MGHVLGLFFDMLSMNVLKNMQWQTSGRIVQELNVCTVHVNAFFSIARFSSLQFFVQRDTMLTVNKPTTENSFLRN